MSKQYVIGERTRNEWVAQFEKSTKNLTFCTNLDEVKKYKTAEEAQQVLDEMRETGYFGELLVYLLENGVTYIMDERDSYHPVVGRP